MRPSSHALILLASLGLAWTGPLIAADGLADQADSVLLGRVIDVERCKEHGNEGHNSQRFGYYAVIEIGQVIKGATAQPGAKVAVRIGGYWDAVGREDRMLPRDLEAERGGKPIDLHANVIIVGFFAPPAANAEAPKDLAPLILLPDPRSGLFRISHKSPGDETLVVRPVNSPDNTDGELVDEFAKRTGISWNYPPR